MPPLVAICSSSLLQDSPVRQLLTRQDVAACMQHAIVRQNPVLPLYIHACMLCCNLYRQELHEFVTMRTLHYATHLHWCCFCSCISVEEHVLEVTQFLVSFAAVPAKPKCILKHVVLRSQNRWNDQGDLAAQQHPQAVLVVLQLGASSPLQLNSQPAYDI